MTRHERHWLTAALLLMAFAVGAQCGCANPMMGFQSALTATATITTAGYRAADQYDAEKQPTLTSLDAVNAYKAKRDPAMKVLATAADLVRSGDIALKAPDAAKRKDWPTLTVQIIAIGIQAKNALDTWGVKLPGGL